MRIEPLDTILDEEARWHAAKLRVQQPRKSDWLMNKTKLQIELMALDAPAVAVCIVIAVLVGVMLVPMVMP